ncbi:MAG: ABC transporter ATP-binding protein [Bacillota bacterium]
MQNKPQEMSNLPPIGGGGPGGMGRPGGPPGMRQEVVKPKNSKETFLRLWSYLGKHKFLLITALVFVMINSLFTTLATYQIRPIMNGLISQAGTSVLMQNLSVMCGIYLIAVISQYIQARIMLEIAQKSLSKLRTDLYVAMEKLPLKFYDANQNGELMSRFTNDVDIINQMLSTTCVSLVSGVVTLAATVAIMFYTNWFLALVTMLITPIFTKITKTISKKSMKHFKGQQQSIGKLNGYIEERIHGQKVIKVFNHEEETIAQFQKYNDEYRDDFFKAQFLSGIMGPVMGSIAQLGYVITSCVGGLMCVAGKFDVGGFTIFLGYSKSFSRPINDIFMQVNTIFSALAGAERVFAVMNETAETPDQEMATTIDEMKGEVVFSNVEFGYNPDKIVLHDLSLTAKSNQKIAFVGSTGAGKTTITNVLNRFYEIQGGTITIDGMEIRDLKKEFLRKNIAMVLQDTHLFTGTIRENIRYGRLEASDDEVIAAAKTANADKFIRRLEKGYDTLLDGDGGSLSAGQRQLLNIARAVISKAPILVLDEATSSVDTRTERQIEEAMQRLMVNRTTFVIAHRLSTVRNSDLIIVLEQGRIIEQGSHETLLELKGKYHDLCTGEIKLT